MSVYHVKDKYNRYFEPYVEYLEIWKLEVLPDYQGKGFGTALVKFAKEFGLPNQNKSSYKIKKFLGERWAFIQSTMKWSATWVKIHLYGYQKVIQKKEIS